MANLKKEIKRAILGTRLFNAALKIAFLGAKSDPSGHHVLIPAPGRGNIGDVAMLEAFAEGVAGDVVAVLRSRDDYGTLPPRVTPVILPGLIYGRVFRAARDGFRLRRLVTDARSVSIVGADIMDGAYSDNASSRRSIIAKHAALAGADTRVLGFSWNSSPTPRALKSIRNAARAGTKLLPRDPASHERLVKSSIPNVHEVADIVFSTTTREPMPDDIKVPRGRYAIVNASSYVEREADTLHAYVQLLEDFHSADLEVILLPHVVRRGGDPSVTRAIYSALRPAAAERTTLVDRMLTPRQVRELASGAHAVVTGRMHLSVMSLRQGIPTAVVGTQGKVEGMMNKFGTLNLVIRPGEIATGSLSEAARTLLAEHDQISAQIAEALPEVVKLAEGNLSGLAA